MFNLSKISDYLRDKLGFSAKDIRYRQDDDSVIIYIDKSLVVKKASKGRVTHRQLSSIKLELESEFKRKFEFIILEDESQSILEKSLGVILKEKFETFIALTLIFVTNKSVDISVTLEKENRDVSLQIREVINSILPPSGLEVGSIVFKVLELDLPSKMMLLRVIKVNQPITKKQLLGSLKQYPDISDTWIKRILDQLRKDTLIIWQRQSSDDKNGCYALTSTGLSIVPAGKSFHSSDIERALALAKRKW